MSTHFLDLSQSQQKWILEIQSIKNSDMDNYALKYCWIEDLYKKLKSSGLELSEIKNYLGKN
jgi:hypothetical protein